MTPLATFLDHARAYADCKPSDIAYAVLLDATPLTPAKLVAADIGVIVSADHWAQVRDFLSACVLGSDGDVSNSYRRDKNPDAFKYVFVSRKSDADTAATAFHSGCRVYGIAASGDKLPPAVLALSDFDFQAPPVSMVVHQIVQAVVGSDIPGLDGIDMTGMTIQDLSMVARKGMHPDDVVRRLKRAARSRTSSITPVRAYQTVDDDGRVGGDGIKLSQMRGYGKAFDWGMRLAADLKAYKDGALDWLDVDRGVLLSSAPGCGKTTFARALANEAGARLYTTSYSDLAASGSRNSEIEKALRKLFADAVDTKPSIIFIDEVDSIPRRDAPQDHNSSYFNALANTFLGMLDGSFDRAGVVVIGATNRPDAVDPAMLRPGRLDRHIVIDPPTIADLVHIATLHLGTGADLIGIGKAAVALRGKTGADVEMLCRDARRTARYAGRPVGAHDLIRAVEQGRPKMTRAAEMRISLHEAGHAVVAVALGVNCTYVDLDRSHAMLSAPTPGSSTRRDLEDILVVYLAGRAAEVVFLDEPAGGSMGDLEQATAIVQSMMLRTGLGGRLLSGVDDFRAWDAMEAVLQDCHKRAVDLVAAHKSAVETLSGLLRRDRYVDGKVVSAIVAEQTVTDEIDRAALR